MGKSAPNRSLERLLWADGHTVVVGFDEVGRGAWAGPLMVGAAVIPVDKRIVGVRDSKMLAERERERLFDKVAHWCAAWSVGAASQTECDELGMSAAQKLAARRALDSLGVIPDAVVIDGKWDFVCAGVRTERMVRADAKCVSVAAASILAKVTRDRYMRAEDEHYPGYGFDSNKGYPCATHRAALHWQGPSSIHRRSWVFMESLSWPGVSRFFRPGEEPDPTLF
jgi:ribonuclease HII